MRTCTLAPIFALFSFAVAQASQHSDGPIVPFSSALPACASNCGPLYDVQGKCSPPVVSVVNLTCFCVNSQLKPFDDAGTAGVSQVCRGVGSCTAASDLQSIKSWYDSYCANSTTGSTTTSSGLTTSSTRSSSATPLRSASSVASSISTSASPSHSATPAPINNDNPSAYSKAGSLISATIGSFLLLLVR